MATKLSERPYRNRPLTARQKRRNRAKSLVRVRMDHVFGTMRTSLRARWNRCIGQVRKTAAITLTNLVYNLVSYEPRRGAPVIWRAGRCHGGVAGAEL